MRQSTGHPGCDCGGEMGKLGREYLARAGAASWGIQTKGSSGLSVSCLKICPTASKRSCAEAEL